LDANPICVRCGAPATQADHIIAVALGGDLEHGALQSMCERCHRAKTVRDSHQAAKRAAADRRRT
jgi:5-methylcytosine-specific restriction endonuclease McrA